MNVSSRLAPKDPRLSGRNAEEAGSDKMRQPRTDPRTDQPLVPFPACGLTAKTPRPAMVTEGFLFCSDSRTAGLAFALFLFLLLPACNGERVVLVLVNRLARIGCVIGSGSAASG